MLFRFAGKAGVVVAIWEGWFRLVGKGNSGLHKLGRTIRGYKRASIEMEAFSFSAKPLYYRGSVVS